MSNPRVSNRDESQSDRLAQKSTDTPFIIIGILGLLGVCGYGVYKYKTKGNMSTSVLIIQQKGVVAGTIVSAITLGLAYTMVRDHILKDVGKKE